MWSETLNGKPQTAQRGKTIRFSDLADVNPSVDCSHLKPDANVSFIPMADVSDSGQWVEKQTRAYAEVRNGYSVFQEGDILFAKITPCTENGKGCHALGLTNGLGFGSTEFHILRARAGINARLVYHFSVAQDLRARAASLMGGSAGQQRVPSGFFKLFQISASCLEDQDRKAKLFDAIDDAIEATQAVIKQTRQLKTALLQDLLTNGLPGRHREFKNIRGLGRIPASWVPTQLGKLTTLVTSGSRGWSKYLVDSGAFFVRSQNIGLGTILRDDVVYVNPPRDQESQRARIQPGDLLISVTGEPGNVACADESLGEAYVSQHVGLVRLENPKIAPWVTLALSTPVGQAQFRSKMYGQTRPGLNLDNLEELQIPIPEENEKRSCCELVRAIEEREKGEAEKLKQLEVNKIALSQGLLTGRVPVFVAEKEVE